MFDWQAAILTLKLAGVTTLCLLCLALPLAWQLARMQHWSKQIFTAFVSMPLVLPPTVLGFYLLMFMGPNGPVGELMSALDLAPLVFSFPGLVVGSMIYSLPFAVQPLQNAFENIQEGVLEAAATLGASPLDRFFSVVLPLARPGLITAAVLSFAHTVGEFGVILMIGGNIPGETRVMSIAIYDHVEALEYEQAHLLAGSMVAFCFIVLLLLYLVNRRNEDARSARMNTLS